jgi:hypothetical protein
LTLLLLLDHLALLQLVLGCPNHRQKLLLLHVSNGCLVLDIELVDLALGQVVEGNLSTLPVNQDYLGRSIGIRLSSLAELALFNRHLVQEVL